MLLFKKILKNWLYVDTRTLALFRIVFGVVGLIDVLRRFPMIDVFYSDAGMNFRRQVTSKYSIKYFTLLEYVQGTAEVHFFFILAAICFFFLIIGYYTRIFQFLAAIGLISIHNAAVILENGGDMVFNNYLIWTLFLPLGTSWSVDSIRKSLKKQPENDSNDLNQAKNVESTQIFHFAYLACLVQLSLIYFYTTINKTGAMWSDGTAVYYMYQLETFLTPVGEWIAQYVGHGMSSIMILSTLPAQMYASFAILCPVLQPWLRRIALVIFIGFHGVLAISVHIGLFSWVMLAVLIFLLSHQDMDIFKSLLSRCCTRQYTVFYDRDCGFCHLTARVLKRMDIFSRLKWADRLSDGDKPENINTLLETTIVVWDPETDEFWTRHMGFSRIISALPLGSLFAWILRVPGFEKLVGYIYDWVSNNRTSISKMTGQPACGIVHEGAMPKVKGEENPIVIKCRKGIWAVSNILVLILIIGAVDYSVQINDGLQKRFSKEEKKIKKSSQSAKFQSPRQKMKRILLFPRMYQKWNMFSPKVITYEKWVIADITFENGETLSLFRSSDDIINQFKREYFPPYQNQFWRKLFSRLGKSSYQRHIPKFKKWLTDTDYFPEYAGRKVTQVQLWQLSEKSPNLDTPVNKRPKVTKRELKKTQRGAQKRRESPIKKNQKKRPGDKLKLK